MPEVAAIISSGCFLDYFVRPDYQPEAISSFLLVQKLEEGPFEGFYKCVCIRDLI